MPDELVLLLEALIRAGFRVELEAVLQASYRAVIRNAHKQEVGDIEYRAGVDEPCVWAQGISYAGWVFDIERHWDPALDVLRKALHEK